MRDYLLDSGVAMKVVIPANVIRAAFQAGLIDDGEAWMDAKKARNEMAHEYSRSSFEDIVIKIKDRYHPLLVALDARLEEERAAGN